MTKRDPFEILASLDPVDPARLRGAGASPRARATLESILEQPTPVAPGLSNRLRRPTRRRRRIYLAAAVAVAAVAAGTAWALTTGVSQSLTIGCYAAPTLTARTIVLPAGNASATQTCRTAWQQGEFGSVRTPQLQACVLPSGAVGVFPAADACQRLKLAPLTTERHRGHRKQHEGGSAIALKNSLVHAYLGHRCLSRSAGLRLAKDEIQTLRMAGWRVRIATPFTHQRSCASYAFDEQQQLVLVIPMPPR